MALTWDVSCKVCGSGFQIYDDEAHAITIGEHPGPYCTDKCLEAANTRISNMNIEITETKTNKPKLTVAKNRVALKFHHQLSQEERAPYTQYAMTIAKQIGEPEFTLRGKFATSKDGVDYITLTGKGKRKEGRSMKFTLSENGEYQLAPKVAQI
jgi:hypothetical protein